MKFKNNKIENYAFLNLVKEKIYFKRGVGRKYLQHPEFEKWHKYFITEYSPPKNKDVLFFHPCSWAKPYDFSFIIHKIKSILDRFSRIHRVIISNAGVIPCEYQLNETFCSYDWNPFLETKQIKELYFSVTKKRVKNYLKRHLDSYNFFYANFRRDSMSVKAISSVFKELGIDINILPSMELWKKYENKSYFDFDEVLIEKELLDELLSELKKGLR